MLGYVISTGQGAGDRLLASVAEDLAARGLVLAGAVQRNLVFDPDRPCHMDLSVLGQPAVVRISQDRGRHATGCRLDPQALTEAVRRVELALARGGVSLVIVNKFGRQEAEGGGFREVIGRALLDGIPVLVAVSPGHLADFLAFADGMATELPPDPAQVTGWCLRMRADLPAA